MFSSFTYGHVLTYFTGKTTLLSGCKISIALSVGSEWINITHDGRFSEQEDSRLLETVYSCLKK